MGKNRKQQAIKMVNVDRGGGGGGSSFAWSSNGVRINTFLFGDSSMREKGQDAHHEGVYSSVEGLKST